eukprot:5289571-Amphidinium_carterae.4
MTWGPQKAVTLMNQLAELMNPMEASHCSGEQARQVRRLVLQILQLLQLWLQASLLCLQAGQGRQERSARSAGEESETCPLKPGASSEETNCGCQGRAATAPAGCTGCHADQNARGLSSEDQYAWTELASQSQTERGAWLSVCRNGSSGTFQEMVCFLQTTIPSSLRAKSAKTNEADHIRIISTGELIAHTNSEQSQQAPPQQDEPTH